MGFGIPLNSILELRPHLEILVNWIQNILYPPSHNLHATHLLIVMWAESKVLSSSMWQYCAVCASLTSAHTSDKSLLRVTASVFDWLRLLHHNYKAKMLFQVLCCRVE